MALRDVKLDDKYDLVAIPRIRHRLPGAGAALPDAEGARSPQRPQYRRLCHRLSRLAARRSRRPVHARGAAARPNDIRFQAAINEDLAATAVWGAQQAELRGEGKYDGVFAMWYGKGPGVDRTGDVFRHANLAGTAKHGGVLALMGDDHTAESSTTAHQSEYHFIDVMIPVLNPAGVQEVVDYGLYGWAMSRFTGAWVALKTMHETIESTAVIDGSLDRVNIVIPTDFRMPEGGLNIRLGDPILAQEARLHDFKRDAMLAFVRANKLNRIITSGGRAPKIGIITTGKSYLDVRQAFDELGIDEVRCNELGMRLYKIGCPWPIARRELADFAAGLDLVIVVEEKRSLIEVQVREELYGSANQPVVHRQARRSGQLAVPRQGRARCQRGRDLHRRTAPEIPSQRRTRAARRAAEGIPAHRRRDPRHRPAHSLFLLRLSAQFLDRGAGRHARLCRHRLPFHGAMDGPFDARLHPDGRRGRELGRRGAVLHPRPRLSEPRRRHLQSFRLHGDPRRDRLQHQHHLQNPVQRRRGDDRRPGQ